MTLKPAAEFVSKTHLRTRGIGALKPVFVPALPMLDEEDSQADSLLCPVSCMKRYLEVTDAFRDPSQ